ncbi:MAG: cell division protein ZapA [Clostridia bacterium]|nr:cell division protein ZapA [Clostridia bacterium]
MEKNKVTITIRNQKYTVISSEAPDDIKALADKVDKKLSEIMTSSRLTLAEALVLASLDLANEARINEQTVNKLKSEMAGYLEDAEKAMIERDKLKRELAKIKDK